MNSIAKFLPENKILLRFFAVAMAALMVFAVLPLIPNTNSNNGGTSLTLNYAAAQDAGGGGDAGGGDSGGGGDTGGGDAGGGGDTGGGDSGGGGDTGSGDAGGGGDTGTGDSGGGGDTGTGDGDTGGNSGGGDGTPTTPVPPVCSLTTDQITYSRGQLVTLSWTTQNAHTVTIDQTIGSVALNGSRTVAASNTNITYTLTAVGPEGTVTCVKTIAVIELDPLTCDAFTASPGTLNLPGNTTLTWSTSNATNVTINNGIGAVSLDGSQSVFVNANTSYTLTATRLNDSITCVVPVMIVPNVIVPRCDAFTVSPTRLSRGNTATLSWDTTNATNVSINQNIGAVTADGTRTVTVDENTTYILTVTNGAASTNCQATVEIETGGGGGGGGGGGSSGPRCTLKASDKSITSGQKVTLSWKNTRTNEIILKDNRGNELIDTNETADEKKYNEDEDSIDVRPTKSTSYTLTVYKGSKKRSCTVDINVENVSVTSTRTRDPLVAGISLSRVPYTGFDAGPIMTGLFYLLLVVWALAVAYILVIRRESVLGVSLKSKATPIREDIFATSSPMRSMHKMAESPSAIKAPQVSLMEPPMRTIPPPRIIPVGAMASKNAAIGYEAYYADGDEVEEIQNEISVDASESNSPLRTPPNFALLEARAHDARVLVSTDALRFITAQSGNESDHIELLDKITSVAKGQFPTEDGWVVINKDRILTLLK